MSGESKKTERLLKLGIITSEQAKSLSSQVAMGNGDGKAVLHKSDIMDVKPGDVFLICSGGLTNTLDDEKIHEIMSMNKDSSYMANLMVKEALKKGEKDNITALILKIENTGSESEAINRREKPSFRSRTRKSEGRLNENSKTVAAAVIACVVVIGVLVAVFYRTWMVNKHEDTAAGNSVTTEASSTSEPAAVDQNESTTEDTGVQQPDNNEAQEPKDSQEEQKPEETKTDGSTTDSTGDIEHVVKSGDTLQKISKKYYGTIEKYEEIMKRNGLDNPNQLKVGQTLIIPKE